MSKTKVLLATDGSPASLRAARVAGELARKDPEMTVTLLYVAHVPRELTTRTYGDLAIDLSLDVLIQRSAQPVIEETRRALGLADERVAAEVQFGEPVEEIIEMAHAEGFDLIVMGSRGRSPLTGLLMGSVSDRVAHLSPCPILIVK